VSRSVSTVYLNGDDDDHASSNYILKIFVSIIYDFDYEEIRRSHPKHPIPGIKIPK
jgi:hypothetical protein